MIKLINDNILIEIIENSKKSILEIAEQYKEKSTTGIIVAISAENCEELKINDTVRFRKGLLNNFKIDNKEYLLCSLKDIVGVI